MADSEHPPTVQAEPSPDPGLLPHTEPVRPAPDDVGPVTAVSLLIDEARAAVADEIGLIKALATAGAQTGRNVGILAVVAVLIGLVAMMTLAIGAMFGIAAQLGFGAATAIVVGTLLVVGAIVALMIRSQIARFRAAARGDQP